MQTDTPESHILNEFLKSSFIKLAEEPHVGVPAHQIRNGRDEGLFSRITLRSVEEIIDVLALQNTAIGHVVLLAREGEDEDDRCEKDVFQQYQSW